jgi:hypothetical protein
MNGWTGDEKSFTTSFNISAGKKTLMLLQSVSAGLHHQVHHPTTLVHAVCLCHLLSCLRAPVYVFFWNRIESYNRYTRNMQETWKSMLQPELPSLLSRSPSFFRARLHVCLLQQEWSKSILSVRLQGRLHLVGLILPLL